MKKTIRLLLAITLSLIFVTGCAKTKTEELILGAIPASAEPSEAAEFSQKIAISRGIAFIRATDPTAKDERIVHKADYQNERGRKFSGAGRVYELNWDCTEIYRVSAWSERTLNTAQPNSNFEQNIKDVVLQVDPEFFDVPVEYHNLTPTEVPAEDPEHESAEITMENYLHDETSIDLAQLPKEGQPVLPRNAMIRTNRLGEVTEVFFYPPKQDVDAANAIYEQKYAHMPLIKEDAAIKAASKSFIAEYKLDALSDRLEINSSKLKLYYVQADESNENNGLPYWQIELFLSVPEAMPQPAPVDGPAPTTDPYFSNYQPYYTALYSINAINGEPISIAHGA